MTREEFIGKLRSIYVGEENAIDEIISEYDSMINLNNQLVEECQKLDDEEARLNNIINELDGMIQGDLDGFFTINNYGACNEIIEVLQNYKDKLKALKENK